LLAKVVIATTIIAVTEPRLAADYHPPA